METVTFLTREIALVHATWKWPGMRPLSPDEPEVVRGIITTVVVRRGGKWLIRALHHTIAAPA